MFEILILVLIALIYVIPFKGIVQVSEDEGEFMDKYDSFDGYVVYEETEVEDLIGGGVTGEEGMLEPDYPTFVGLEDMNNDFEDIDISGMGGSK